MTELSRRRFLRNASLGAAGAVAATSALPALLGAAGPTAAQAAPAPSGPPLNDVEGPLIAHVRDAHSGEISIFVGTQEITYQDRHLAQALLRAAQ